MAGPLSHIRVLDLSRVLAGPWCGQNLADLGAEVIKIERPKTGDDSRAFGPPWLKGRDGKDTTESAYFLAANRGKKSVTVDLSRPEGQKIARALAAKCDVLLENFKAGDLARYGLGPADLKPVNPGLIYCSVTGFGQTGPHRERTGIGRHLDLALLDTQVAILANQAMNYLATGEVPGRIGNAHPNIVPYQTFRTKDGDIILACGNDNLFNKFCEVAGCRHLARDARFATNAKRVENRAALAPLLAEIFLRRTTHEWVAALEAAGVPNGPINDIGQVFEEPQVRARGIKIELEHPLAGRVPLVASPMRFSATPVEYRLPPPALGQHTEEILRGMLGLDDAEIARLRADGVT